MEPGDKPPHGDARQAVITCIFGFEIDLCANVRLRLCDWRMPRCFVSYYLLFIIEALTFEVFISI